MIASFVKDVPQRYIRLDGGEFPLNLLWAIMDELKGSCSINPVCIHNAKLSDALESMGVLRKTIRGCYPGKNFEQFDTECHRI